MYIKFISITPCFIQTSILIFSNNSQAINKVQKWFVEETRMGIPVDFTNERIHGMNYDRGTPQKHRANKKPGCG